MANLPKFTNAEVDGRFRELLAKECELQDEHLEKQARDEAERKAQNDETEETLFDQIWESAEFLRRRKEGQDAAPELALEQLADEYPDDSEVRSQLEAARRRSNA